jgi:hypothetical protein
MFANRLFYLLIALFVVAACAPQAASTPIASKTSSLPTVEASPVIEPMLTPTASPIVELSPLEFKGHIADVWSVDSH